MSHPTAKSWTDPFGSNRLGLWLADRRDRKAGLTHRVAARWGWLKPMGERGKVVWIVAGAERDSVRLAVELLRAIRARRLDIRLVLTYEHEYPELLALLDDCDKTGWGFAPCDHPKATARVLQRFEPFGVVLVGTRPRPNLLAALAGWPRLLAVNVPDPIDFACERVYASNESATAQANQAPIADMRAILAEAQVDPNFKSLVNGNAERHLWWLHGASPGYAGELAQALFRLAPQDILFVSGERPPAAVIPMSSWNREPPAGGSVMWVDDSKWLPGIAAAVTAAHLVQFDAAVLWQAMAGGAALSRAPGMKLPKAALAEAVPEAAGVAALWYSYRDAPIAARKHGDTARRLFWQERRLAESVSRELVERIFEW
ncbi:MAG TPA: hypothetical protein VMV97_04795 [Sulfuriferula sp.]|nr:hypothetical protein [Sulfuriferula sp.]